jgi:hypothetical protein
MIGGITQNIIIFDIENLEKIEISSFKQKDLLVELLSIKDTSSNSTISSVLLKLILEYCTPIIDEIPNVTISSRDIIKRSNIKVESKIEIEKGISILFDRDINCLYKKNKIKLIAGQMAVVIGFVVPNIIRSNLWLSIYDYLSTNTKYNINTILKSGLYSFYNCYKNYFFNSYLTKPLSTKEFEIYFSNNVSENNLKILKYLEYCRSLNNLNSSILLLTIKSILKEQKLIEMNNIINKIISNEEKLVNLLIENKLIDSKQIRYLQIGNIFNNLIDKINWHGGFFEPNAKKYVEELKILIENGVNSNNEKNQNYKQQIEIAKKKIIAFEKFGTSDINNLTKNQQNTITQEYSKKHKEKEIIKESPLFSALLSAINSQDKVGLTNMISFIFKEMNKTDIDKFNKQLKNQESKVDSYIKLKDGNICPHMLEQAIQLKDGKDITIVENWLINKYGIQSISKSKYISVESDTYCKICGALLAEYDEESIAFKERDNYVISFEDDELFTMVKRELQYILSYYLYQPEKSPLSISNIIDLLSGIIRAKILEIQSELIKIKTLGDNDMWILINIYIYIYIFAILTQFVFANPEILQFKFTSAKPNKYTSSKIKVGNAESKIHITSTSKEILSQLLKHKQGKSNLERLTNHALELIKKIKYSDILASKYITTSNIKELFLTAYKWTLTLNYNVESIEDLMGKQTTDLHQTDVKQNNVLSLFSKYGNIGRSYDDIEKDFTKSKSVYDTIKLNKEVPKSIELIFDYIVNEKYYIKPVSTVNQELTDITNKLIEERYKENKNNLLYKSKQLRPLGQYPKYELSDYKLELPFNLVGNCSKDCSKTYMYRPSNKKDFSNLKEYKESEIVEWLTTKNKEKLQELYKMECLGLKCVCKEKINQQILLFYKYFEQFCPKGELHEYDLKKCKKCGITNDIIKNNDNDFYKKYKEVFNKTRNKEISIINSELEKRLQEEKKINQNIKKSDKEKFSEWVISTKEVSNLSKIVNIKNLYNLFCSIGMYEGQYYSKLESNQVHPYIDATSESYINQALSIHNYILYITRNYNLTKNSEYMVKIPIDIKNLLTKTLQNNKDFSKKLDEIDLKYIEQYDWYCGQKIKPNKLANFCLTYLAKLFLTIDNIFKKAKLDKFGKAWIQFYIAKIIGLEKTLTVIPLKYLKPLAKYENENDINLDDTRYEDGDELDSKVGEEDLEANESIIENYEEVGDEYKLDDVDIEKEDDELNQDNSYITVD